MNGRGEDFSMAIEHAIIKVHQDKRKERQFQVPFNPNTLKISAYAGKVHEIRDMSGSGKNYSYKENEINVELSVQLLFDNSNNPKYNVQAQIEGLMEALKNSNTRVISFYWGKQYYYGILKQVAADCSMFDITGNLMRATVDLIIDIIDME